LLLDFLGYDHKINAFSVGGVAQPFAPHKPRYAFMANGEEEAGTMIERLDQLIELLIAKGVITRSELKPPPEPQQHLWIRPDPIAERRFERLLALLGLDSELPEEEMTTIADELCAKLGCENLLERLA
jgi:hypothetical protein